MMIRVDQSRTTMCGDPLIVEAEEEGVTVDVKHFAGLAHFLWAGRSALSSTVQFFLVDAFG